MSLTRRLAVNMVQGLDVLLRKSQIRARNNFQQKICHGKEKAMARVIKETERIKGSIGCMTDDFIAKGAFEYPITQDGKRICIRYNMPSGVQVGGKCRQCLVNRNACVFEKGQCRGLWQTSSHGQALLRVDAH